MFELSVQQKNEYLNQGFTSIKNAISSELLNRLQKMAKNFEKKVIENYKKGIDTPEACIFEGKILRYNNIVSLDYETTLDLLASPVMIAIFRDICGKGPVPFMMDLFFKKASTNSTVLWHQDAPHSRNYPYVNVGIFLDDADEDDGCLRYVPNTQNKKQDIYIIVQEFDWDIPNSVEMPAKAGDINIHDMMILHGSKPKKTKNQRRTIYVEIRPFDAIIDSKIQTEKWAQLRNRFMGLVLRRANLSLLPEEWIKDYPTDLKSDEEEIFNIFKNREPAIPANYAFPFVKRKDYQLSEKHKDVV